MKVLILASTEYVDTPYDEWLKDLDVEIFIVTAKRRRKSFQHFENVLVYSNYWLNQTLELDLVQLATDHKFDVLLAKDEWDILRAARIRERAHIPGQSVASADAFRDKVTMKSKLAEKKIAVAPFRAIQHIFDVVDFIDEVGYPVVVKPRDGVGGAHTLVLKSEAELKDYFFEGLKPNMMIEKFIKGSMYHVDGLVQSNEVLFSCSALYINTCLSYQCGDFSGSLALDLDDPLHLKLEKFVNEVIRALPTPDVSAFHAEVFVTESGELVLCEIASRTGGARIVENIETNFGVNLVREWTRMQCGLSPKLPKSNLRSPLWGHAFVPRPPGRVAQCLPQPSSFSWVRSERVYVESGEASDEEEGRRQNLASALIQGRSPEELIERMKRWSQHWQSETQWI